MENWIKMFIMGGLLILVSVIHRVIHGTNATILIGGMVITGIGFGWYASLTKQEEDKKRTAEVQER